MTCSDKYTGCFLGLAVGDALGARCEGGPVERLLWKLIGKTAEGKNRYTDDTQMSIDLASSLLLNEGVDQEHLAITFANSYRWSRGYGPGAAKLLKKIRNGARWQDVNRGKFKEGSFGNGAAMRAPVLAMFYANALELLDDSVRKASEITHAHPLAIEGARLIAFVTYAALHDWDTQAIFEALPNWCESDEYKSRIELCVDWVQGQHKVTNKELKCRLGNGIAAHESCVTAIYFALNYRGHAYAEMLQQISRLGGDADTLGAMAGAIWGAFNGGAAIDPGVVQEIENSEKIITLANRLYTRSSGLAL